MDKKNFKTCDVVMPAYNNSAVLKHSLPALFSQEIPAGWQVRLIGSDDGSGDDTVNVLKKFKTTAPWGQTAVLTGKHTGAAGARNRGAKHARGNVVLLLGADIILRPGALREHLLWHEKYPANNKAALGVVKWDPRLEPSPFMEWMIHGGTQNNFDDVLGRSAADPCHFFYASNLSIKREILTREPFSERFDVYGWEDLELGRRLKERGLKLKVLPRALGLHRHYYSVPAILNRQQHMGRGAVIYQEMYPRQRIITNNSPWKKLKRQAFIYSGLPYILAAIIKKTGRKISTPRFFSFIVAVYFWRGVYNIHRDEFSKKSAKS